LEVLTLKGAHWSAFEDTGEVPGLVAACYGTVLELGHASGNQLPRFDKSKVTHIFGIEPNASFEDAIAAKITATGLEGKYTAITCGIEDVDILAKHGLKEGTLDCVLSVQVLCSVQDPVESAKVIYGLLKEGGELVFWEHHQSHDWLSRAVQREFFLCDW